MTAAGLNIIGIVFQFFGFVIVVVDLWPEYSKARRRQLLWLAIDFLRHSGGYYPFNYQNYDYRLPQAMSELRKHWPDVPHLREPNPKMTEIRATVERDHAKWIEAINKKKSLRSMHLPTGLGLIGIGYLMVLTSALMEESLWPF